MLVGVYSAERLSPVVGGKIIIDGVTEHCIHGISIRLVGYKRDQR